MMLDLSRNPVSQIFQLFFLFRCVGSDWNHVDVVAHPSFLNMNGIVGVTIGFVADASYGCGRAEPHLELGKVVFSSRSRRLYVSYEDDLARKAFFTGVAALGSGGSIVVRGRGGAFCRRIESLVQDLGQLRNRQKRAEISRGLL